MRSLRVFLNSSPIYHGVSYSADYSHHVLHSSLVLTYNWKFVPFDYFPPISPPQHTALTHTILSCFVTCIWIKSQAGQTQFPQDWPWAGSHGMAPGSWLVMAVPHRLLGDVKFTVDFPPFCTCTQAPVVAGSPCCADRPHLNSVTSNGPFLFPAATPRVLLHIALCPHCLFHRKKKRSHENKFPPPQEPQSCLVDNTFYLASCHCALPTRSSGKTSPLAY